MDLDPNDVTDVYNLLIQRNTALAFRSDRNPVCLQVDMSNIFTDLNKSLGLSVVELTVNSEEVIVRDEAMCICIPRGANPYVTKVYPKLKDARKLSPIYKDKVFTLLRDKLPTIYYSFKLNTF